MDSKKNEMLIFGLCSLLMICLADWWTWTPSATPLLPKNWNAQFSITFNFWWSAGLVDGLKPHLPPLSSQKHEMLNFVLHLISDVGQTCQWTRTPSTTPLQPKKWNASFLDYTQLLMIGRAGWWTQTPSTIPLQPKKWNAHFWITFNFWMIGRAGQWTRTPSTTHLQPIKWNAYFWITLNFWWLAGLVDGLKPHPPPLFSKKMKWSFLDYVQLLMISQAGRWTQTPSATPLQPKKWNAHFWIMLNFWWLAGLVDGLKPHPPPLFTQKNEMLIFGLCSTSDDWLSCSIDLNPIHHPSPAKNMKCLFLYNIQHLMLARLVNGLKPHLPLSLAKKWNVHFWIMFNFW